MNQQKLHDRLKSKLKHEQLLLWLGALAALVGGIIVLFLTFWSTYAILWFTTYWWLETSHQMRMILAGVFLILLFIGNATTDREYLDHIELDISPHRTIEVAVARAAGAGWMLAFSDPKAARSSIKMFTTLLYTGPRAVMQSWELVRRAIRLGKIDVDPCANAIGRALKADERVPFESLLTDVPEAFQQKCVEDLSYIEGVVILKSNPVGITLAPEFVQELKAKRK